MCTINNNHIIYSSCDMEHNRHNFLSFGTIFCSLSPLTTQKIKILKKWKKLLEILFYCVPKMTITWCMVPETWSTRQNFLSFWTVFHPFTPLRTSKSKFWIDERHIILHMCTINENHMMYGSWDMKYNRHNYLPFLFFALLHPPPPTPH